MNKALILSFGVILGILMISIASASITGKVTVNVVGTGNVVARGQMMVGNDSDAHGCKGSAGYSWCESLKECIRVWETNCTESEKKNESIKIMPETASETAIARLGIKVCNESNNCTIELKEVGSGNETRKVYEMKSDKEVKLFGFIKTKMHVEAQVDSENGQVVSTKKPWWAFLAKEN